ncbi:MAG: hypothetical protein RLP44_31235 [Aggregatilineales bacterium]
MRRLRRLLLFIGIVCGLCVIFVYTVLMPAIDEVFECFTVPTYRATHLVWSDDSEHILVRFEIEVALGGGVEWTVIPLSSEEEVITHFTGSLQSQYGIDFYSVEPASQGNLPDLIRSPDQRLWASLRRSGNDLDVYVRGEDNDNNERVYRFESENRCYR